MTFNIEVIIFHFQILFKFKDRKSTRLNSSHLGISYAVFCLKKKKNKSELQSLRNLVLRLLRSRILTALRTPNTCTEKIDYYMIDRTIASYTKKLNKVVASTT